MIARGHSVKILSPKALVYTPNAPVVFRKWLSYIDQYLLFPLQVRKSIKSFPADTLFVFTDHALGPWVPLVAERPHVIHCHDFLAQRSALQEVSENSVGWTGRQYQQLIRWGYTHGKNFISVSQKTKEDLHRFLTYQPYSSEVVYNGLNQLFVPSSIAKARVIMVKKFKIQVSNGYFLHVGGNQWYKNRRGVIEIYNAWRATAKLSIPLILIGEPPSNNLADIIRNSPFFADIYVLSGVGDKYIPLAYTGASAFVFPSLAEGFGWPIAEAMASACPVITTNEAPMTEVAGDAGFFIPRRPDNNDAAKVWAAEAAKVLDTVLRLSPTERQIVIEAGLTNAKRFNTESVLNQIEKIYENVLKASSIST